MGRHFKRSHTLSDGRLVGWSLKKRGDFFRVLFPDPSGKYVEKATGCKTESDATVESARLIVRAYAQVSPADPASTTWEHVLDHLNSTPDLRPDSVRSYRVTVARVRKIIPTPGPNAITEAMAHDFKRKFLGGTYAKGKASDAKQYGRSPTTCLSCLRSLRSLWAKHLRPAGFVRSNPWLSVPYPNVPRGKRVRLPAEDAVTELIKWIEAKYPGWELPLLFVQAKSVAGCRTLDLCKVKSSDLNGDVLTLPPAVQKNRAERRVVLPAQLAARLREVAGPTWLWERSVEESRKHRRPRTKPRTDYSASTWRWTVSNIFRDFNSDRPKDRQVRPHDLRARAITLTVKALGSVEETAAVLGVDPQTARHYLDAQAAFNRTDIYRKIAGVLLPGGAPESS